MSQSVLTSTFFEPREPALERVALAADADARGDDAIVGADDAAADVRRRLDRAGEEVAAEREPCRGRANPGAEFAPRNGIRVVVSSGHGRSFFVGCHSSGGS